MQTFAHGTKEFHTFHYGTITSDASYIKISSQGLNAILSFFFYPRPFTRTNILRTFLGLLPPAKIEMESNLLQIWKVCVP